MELVVLFVDLKIEQLKNNKLMKSFYLIILTLFFGITLSLAQEELPSNVVKGHIEHTWPWEPPSNVVLCDGSGEYYCHREVKESLSQF